MSDQAEATPETKDETKGETPSDEMTAEEKKFLMVTLWEALTAPKWTKDPLIDFGKAIFSKKALKDMNDKEFNQVFPFLRDATAVLGRKLLQRRAEVEKANTEDGKKADAAETKTGTEAETNK